MAHKHRLHVVMAITLAIVGSAPTAGQALTGTRLSGSKLCIKGEVQGTRTPVYALRAKNVSCRTAKRAAQRALPTAGGIRISGWTCRHIRSEQDGGYYRCSRGAGTIQFYQGG